MRSACAPLLDDSAVLQLPLVLSQHDSSDGTVKWLFASGSGQAVETVFIPEPGRGTLCISSQVGCALDCAFCATGAQGFNRNLTAAEIVGQVWHANRALPRRGNGEFAVTNVVFMGMGEPLANYRNLLPAIELLLSDLGYGLSRRRVTVSTSGIVPHIDRLGDECNVALAVSLHAPNDALRDRWCRSIASTRSPSCWRPAGATRQNTRTASSRSNTSCCATSTTRCSMRTNWRLCCSSRPAKVNLIPFNPFDGNAFRRSSAETIRQFQARLRQRGLVTTTRKTRGDDIDAACGQLAGKVSDRVRVRLSEKNLRTATA